MKLDIFSYNSYKDYLRDKIQSGAKVTKGLRGQLIEYLHCQSSYLSQVLNGKPNFTLEQAVLLNQFFHHNKLESKYFILLVERSRAGSKELREHFDEEIEEIKKDRSNLKKRLLNTEEINPEDQHKYYSTWFYSAIHVILSIKEFQDPEKIAQHFNLPIELVLQVIDFLESSGLIIHKNNKFELTKKRLHLGSDSVFVQRHHINWRSQALLSAEKNLKDDLHFSTVIAIAKKDFPLIKEIFIKAVHDAREIIRPSEEEALYAITLDFFGM